MAAEAKFLLVECGDFVVIAMPHEAAFDWWVGQVLSKVGSSVNPSVNSLFQIIDIDTGIVKTVNADYVQDIIKRNR